MPVSCSHGKARVTLLKETPSVSTISLSLRATSATGYDGEVRVDFYPTGKSGVGSRAI